MCLYPKLIRNKKYLPNKKNNGNPPICTDERVRFVPVGCGRCIECKKQKAQEWKIRLNEEIHENTDAHFVTLTFSEESLQKLCDELKTQDVDAISTIAIRRFNERWRKKYNKAPRHFLINELGHENTERLHFHGLLWYDKEKAAEVEKIWSYGIIVVGEYVNEKTINYIVKYVTKLDNDHKTFEQHIFASKGLGKNYLKRPNARDNVFRGLKTREHYTLPNGARVNLPIYYRNHIYTEEQREQLWLQKLDQQKQYILGVEHYLITDEQCKQFEKILKNMQEFNKLLGYGEPLNNWDKTTYKVKKEKIRQLTKKK